MKGRFIDIDKCHEYLSRLGDLVESSFLSNEELEAYGGLLDFFNFLRGGHTILLSADAKYIEEKGAVAGDGIGLQIRGMRNELVYLVSRAVLEDRAFSMLIMNAAAYYLRVMVAETADADNEKDEKLDEFLLACADMLVEVADAIDDEIDESRLGSDALGELLRKIEFEMNKN